MPKSLDARRSAAAAAAAAAMFIACATAHAQWSVEYTVRYEAAGQQTGKAGERRGPDMLVSETTRWRVQQEARGTLAFAQKVRGAVASNMPDANNEQRYDAWLHRPGSAGKPAWLKLDAEELRDSAARLGRADGEGAAEINRQRAGNFGRVEPLRERVAVSADGAAAARLGGAFLQIDRVEGKLHFEPPAVDIDPAQMRQAVERVTRIDQPAAAGEWDTSDTRGSADRTRFLRLPQLPVQVFDLPRNTEAFEATRTVDVPGRIGGRATIEIVLRRAGPLTAEATPRPVAPVPATAVAAPPAPIAAAAPPKADCPVVAADGSATAAAAGAEVGGKVLGGGYGRQVGSAIGGVLGALGGAARRAEPAARPDCPR